MALFKAGPARASINARLGAAEMASLLAESDASVLLTDAAHLDIVRVAVPGTGVKTVLGYDGPSDLGPGYAEALADAEPEPVDTECDEGHVAVPHFTSGSTGKLKAAVQGVRQPARADAQVGHERRHPGRARQP
ncbi:AMP-binding protein [Streptomyces sp. NPDC016469]|uniref:AMP-binding protein n=1 Tax=Streptomyces sp. NPDC016469 TaxID=3157191 RepID=UPI0034054B8B